MINQFEEYFYEEEYQQGDYVKYEYDVFVLDGVILSRKFGSSSDMAGITLEETWRHEIESIINGKIKIKWIDDINIIRYLTEEEIEKFKQKKEAIKYNL